MPKIKILFFLFFISYLFYFHFDAFFNVSSESQSHLLPMSTAILFYYSSSVWWQKGGKNKNKNRKLKKKKEKKGKNPIKIHVFPVCSHLRGVGLMSPIIYINSDRSRFRLPKSTTLFSIKQRKKQPKTTKKVLNLQASMEIYVLDRF